MKQGFSLFNRRAIRQIVLGILTAGVFLGPLHAGQATTKRITEGRIDSKCIGDVSDPVCAVETWIACLALERSELCALLGVEGMRFEGDTQPNIFDYKIIEVLPITTDRTPNRLRTKPWFNLSAIEVRVAKRSCFTPTVCKQLAEHSFFPSIYYFKPEGKEWRLAAWTNDVSVTCEYPEPNNPACGLFFWDRATPWVHDQSLYDSYN